MQLFKHLKDNWELTNNQDKYEDASADEVARSGTKGVLKEMVKFIELVLKAVTQPRDDCKLMLMKYIASSWKTSILWNQTSNFVANHHARWMA